MTVMDLAGRHPSPIVYRRGRTRRRDQEGRRPSKVGHVVCITVRSVLDVEEGRSQSKRHDWKWRVFVRVESCPYQQMLPSPVMQRKSDRRRFPVSFRILECEKIFAFDPVTIQGTRYKVQGT